MDFIEKPFEAERLLHAGPARDRDRAPAPRERAAARRADLERRVHRQFQLDQPGARDAEAGRQHRQPRAHHRARRARARKSPRGCSIRGARGPTRPSSRSIRRGSRPSASSRSCSARKRTASWSAPGLLETGRRRHALSRRSGRHAGEHAGADPARADRAELRARRRAAARSAVDVRVVSSSSRDLEKEIAEKRFREDLFYRLNVVPVDDPLAVRAARRHPRRSPTISSPATRPSRCIASPRLRPRRWPRCRPTTGRATCASCAM